VGLLWEGVECASWTSSSDHEGLFHISFFHSVFTQALGRTQGIGSYERTQGIGSYES
jgi:hypothetical protein